MPFDGALPFAQRRIPTLPSSHLRISTEIEIGAVPRHLRQSDEGLLQTTRRELMNHAKLLGELSPAISDFFADLKEHGRENDAVVLVFSEFGRRIKENGSGTDHGSGGMAFVMGGPVKGGFYGAYRSLEPEDQLEGDMRFNNDFRSIYATLLDRWMGVDPQPVLGGTYEQFDMIKR